MCGISRELWLSFNPTGDLLVSCSSALPPVASAPPLHSWLAAGCSAAQTAAREVCFLNETLRGLQVMSKFSSLRLLSSLCPPALRSCQAWLTFVTVGWLFGGAAQGAHCDALISTSLPIPNAAGAAASPVARMGITAWPPPRTPSPACPRRRPPCPCA